MSSNSFDSCDERSFIGSIVKKQTKYGSTTCKNHFKDMRYMKHVIQVNDTLQGLALRYNVSMEVIKRANNLWTNESLFGRTSINIPVDNCNDISGGGKVNISASSSLSTEEITREHGDSKSLIDNESAADFLNRIDSKIAKHETSMIQNETKLTDTYTSDDFLLNSNNRLINVKSYHLTNNKKVVSSIKKLERAQEELFEL